MSYILWRPCILVILLTVGREHWKYYSQTGSLFGMRKLHRHWHASTNYMIWTMLVYSFFEQQSVFVRGKLIGGKVESDLEALLLLVKVSKMNKNYLLLCIQLHC